MTTGAINGAALGAVVRSVAGTLLRQSVVHATKAVVRSVAALGAEWYMEHVYV